MQMATRQYEVRFLTPAFLGNAHQNGQWRTPPIKHLLREWWRVAYAADHGFNVDVAEMRREEGLLFGMATDGDSRKSLVRMRLTRWEGGKETKKKWGKQELNKRLEGVAHPEVGQIGPKLYLGYGPLVVEKVVQAGRRPEYATVLKNNAAIQADEAAVLAFAFPTTHHQQELMQVTEANAPRIEHALWLVDRYGTLGSRSRNGWGSSALTPQEDTPALAGKAPLRDWRDCLDRDWPHAIGQDEQGALVWQTEPHDDWKALMKTLAIVKIGLRTQFKFHSGNNADHPESRHWLSCPVTNHSVRAWGRNARLPNSLRFKGRQTSDGKLVGVLYHMPCLPPTSFRPDRQVIEEVWRRVHAYLDGQLAREELQS